MNPRIKTNRIVLLGIGHTNAHVLRMWKMKPLPDTELICISNFPTASYSGMLPAVLAGQHAPERMEIDLVRLCAASGARLILDDVTGLDSRQRELLFANRPPLPFHAVSIGIGSIPSMSGVFIDSDRVVPIKPMQTFLSRMHRHLQPLARGPKRPLRIAVVGGGAGGVEIAMCLPARIALDFSDHGLELHVIHGDATLLSGMLASTAKKVAMHLQSQGATLHLGRRATSVRADEIELDDGSRLSVDLVIWATGAVALPLLAKLGLPTDKRGFLLTDLSLQVTGHSGIFAVGDTGTIEQATRPKSGVFAVRAGPVVWRNLANFFGSRPLESFQPQKNFLKLLNTGDGRAIAEYAGRAWQHRLAYRWKDWIDTRFIAKYQDYQPMEMSRESNSQDANPQPMRCLGCGGKVNATVLAQVLERLHVVSRPEVVLGLDSPDDAALLRLEGNSLLAVTTDFFAAPLNDHFVVGRIAALNALSDTWAMGSSPVAALAMVTVPVGSERQQTALLTELMAGALHEFRIANVALVGGHTIEGPLTTIGFTVLARQPTNRVWHKSGLQVGDRFVLTKPLGTGILLAAHMQADCEATAYQALITSMTQSNAQAAAIATEFPVRAATDVTGFGLAGHLLEMLNASGARGTVRLDDLPLLPGVADAISRGFESSLAPANRRCESQMELSLAARGQAEFAAIFDPQTSGGLLLAVESSAANALVDRINESGTAARVVGEVSDVGNSDGRIVIE